MDSYFKNIDKQIKFNQGKNIFFGDNVKALKFVDDTINGILAINELNADSEKVLIDYTTDKALDEFYRINQYYRFNSQAKKDLREIYSNLFSTVKANKISIDVISKNHYQNLKKWLQKTNPFAEKIYLNADGDIEAVPCAEYSSEFQINVLKIDCDRINGPILDIGCGKQGNMVKHFCKLGLDAFGIDRFSFTENNLFNSDWLEYDYGIRKWGAIISNLGFSNHFKHHNLREDGIYIEYGKTYMNILNSLKKGGSFYYAPDLPFIEKYLDENQFQLTKHQIHKCDFEATIVKRVK